MAEGKKSDKTGGNAWHRETKSISKALGYEAQNMTKATNKKDQQDESYSWWGNRKDAFVSAVRREIRIIVVQRPYRKGREGMRKGGADDDEGSKGSGRY